MFMTHGPVPPESRLFVGRTAELKLLEAWLSDAPCVGAVLGARQTGKTSLLLKLRHAFRAKYAFTFVDLQAVEGAQTDDCFEYIAEQMVEQLAETASGEQLCVPKEQRQFSTFLRELSRRTRAVRIIVILDEIGALPPETAMKLAGTVRAAFTDRLINPDLARYFFLLAGAVDMLDLTVGRTSPLGNVTERIYLGDLSLVETEQLLAEVFSARELGLVPGISSEIHAWTSGHPYWTQLIAAALDRQFRPSKEMAIEKIVEELLRTEDRNLPHLMRVLKADSALWRVAESLLSGPAFPFTRTNATIAKLELVGFLKDSDGLCRIRNRIYKEGLNRYLRSSMPQLEPAALSSMVRVGTFLLDLKAGELRRGERKVRLNEQSFQILKMLVEHPGDVVTRDEIRQQLWPSGIVVEFDHSINTAVKKLRLALFDSADKPRYVETVGRRGYRLMASVEGVEANPTNSLSRSSRPH